MGNEMIKAVTLNLGYNSDSGAEFSTKEISNKIHSYKGINNPPLIVSIFKQRLPQQIKQFIC